MSSCQRLITRQWLIAWRLAGWGADRTVPSAKVPTSRERSASVRGLLSRLMLLLLVIFSLLGSPVAAELSVRVDPPSVYAGETLDLVIEWKGRASGELQLDPLRGDFDVLGTSQAREIGFVNGRRTDLRRWQIRLRPRAVGSLRIPPIAVGNGQTPEIAIEVRPLPAGALGGPGDEVFVELLVGNQPAAGAVTKDAVTGDSVTGDAMAGSVAKEHASAKAPSIERGVADSGELQATQRAIVQQQLPVIVRLYSARPIRGGTLSDPEAAGAVLQRTAGDREFDTERNGRAYRVIERRYSLSPERSGALQIGPVVFEGELAKAPSGGAGSAETQDLFGRDPMMAQLFGHGPWSSFDRGERVRAQSPTINLEVDPLPESASLGPWLPAEALELNDDWAGQPPAARVGEPLTRTITIVAKGLDANQLPELEFSLPDSVRAYPEPPENETRSDGEHLFGISRQQISLIPTQAGRLELPAIELSWWDLEAKRERQARLPPVMLDVEGASLGDGQAAAPAADARLDPERTAMPGTQPGSPAAQDANPGADADLDGGIAISSIGLSFWLQVLVAGLLLMVLTWAAFRFWLSARLSSLVPGRSGSSGSVLRVVRKSLVQACQVNDPRAAAQALLNWARLRWPDQAIGNLSALAAHLGASPLAFEVRRLQDCLFAPGAGEWNGAVLLVMLDQLDQQPVRQFRSAHAKSSALPPLYPQQH